MLEAGFFPEFEVHRVRRLRDVSEQIGAAYHAASSARNDAEIQHPELIAATYYRRAAAHSTLLGEFGRATELFDKTSRLYHKAGYAYSIIMNALAGHYVVDVPRLTIMENDSADAVYGLLGSLADADSRSAISQLRHLRLGLEGFRGSCLGVLAIPLGRYLDLFDTMEEMLRGSDTAFRPLQETLLPFLQSYSSALRDARRDKFHWERLAMTFHPVEPDLLGVLLIVSKAFARTDLPLPQVLEGIPVGRDAIAAITHCLRNMNRGPNNDAEPIR